MRTIIPEILPWPANYQMTHNKVCWCKAWCVQPGSPELVKFTEATPMLKNVIGLSTLSKLGGSQWKSSAEVLTCGPETKP